MIDQKLRFASLHSHLGSSVKASDLYQFSKLSGHKHNLGEYFEFVNNIHVNNPELHEKYLNRYKVVQEIQSASLEVIEKAVFKAVATAFTEHQCDVIEIRFNPMLRNRGGVLNLDSVLLHACIGLKRAQTVFPVRACLIVETDRTFTPDQTQILFEKAVLFKDMGVKAVDIAGHSPEGFDITQYKDAFSYAHRHGLLVTAHCGETAGPEEIWQFMDNLPLARIGHGINAYKDEALMAELKKRNICLEVCPVSNVMTGVVKGKYDIINIIGTLHSNGVPFTICDDGFLFLGANVRQNYEFVELPYLVFDKAVENGFKHSFC